VYCGVRPVSFWPATPENIWDAFVASTKVHFINALNNNNNKSLVWGNFDDSSPSRPIGSLDDESMRPVGVFFWFNWVFSVFLRYNTIQYDRECLMCTEKLMQSQLNLAHGKIRKNWKQKQIWLRRNNLGDSPWSLSLSGCAWHCCRALTIVIRSSMARPVIISRSCRWHRMHYGQSCMLSYVNMQYHRTAPSTALATSEAMYQLQTRSFDLQGEAEWKSVMSGISH